MVKNSFTDPPIPVPGMSQAVNHIKEQLKIKTQKGRGVNKKQAIETFIIYVTAGPNSLEESHAKFLQEFGFPEGLILSRTINVHNMSPHKFSEMDQAAWRFKIGTIQSIFKWFPNKSYYTLGDSGQKDVEVYAKVWVLYLFYILSSYLNLTKSNTFFCKTQYYQPSVYLDHNQPT
jgi:hypothetical protein